VGALDNMEQSLLSGAAAPAGQGSKNLALAHVAAQTTQNVWLYWSLSAAFACAGLLSTEFHTWAILTTRTVAGCALGENATVPPNATLSSCASAGLFACQASATVTTQVPPSWISGLFCSLLGVVALWALAAYTVSAQNWRASCLLPYHIVVQSRSFNGAFYGLALVATALYMYIKFATFGAQPNRVAARCSGAAITLALVPVFAPAAGAGQWGTLGASFATFWLSFGSVSALISRYAGDSYADVTLSALLTCAGGRAPCDSHDGRPSAVARALQEPFALVPAEALDKLMKRWYIERGLQGRGLKWQEARFLLKLGPAGEELVADAAAFVRAAREGGGGGAAQ
jgi:hypothetical protein